MGGSFVCVGHIAQAENEAAAERQRLAAEARSQREQEARHVLGAVTDPSERLVLASSLLLTPTGSGGWFRFDEGMQAIWDELFPTSPRLWSFDELPARLLGAEESNSIAAWFARRAQDAGLRPNATYPLQYGRRGQKSKDLPSWEFLGRYPIGAHVLLDGRLRPEGEILRIDALRLMAYVLQLPGASQLVTYPVAWGPLMEVLRNQREMHEELDTVAQASSPVPSSASVCPECGHEHNWHPRRCVKCAALL
jgi:hypothetical protein